MTDRKQRKRNILRKADLQGPMLQYKVAAVQTSPVFLDGKATVEKVCRLIDEAANLTSRDN